jgi:Domain of unknown function (DUF5911)
VTERLTGSPRPSRSTLSGSPFPPIAEYGFLSDCEVSALIAASGNVEWMCLPRMDSPSIFAAILDRGAGMFRLGPADVTVPSGPRYLPGTMVLETKAFSHLALINAVMYVINADERLSASASAPSGLDPHLETAAPAASDEAGPAP